MIKAIQTRYAGYLFRSRLEARWVVFLDALKLDWIYEPEGFQLLSGRRYLPDFKINFRNRILWADVKPDGVECKEVEELVVNGPPNWTGVTLNDIPDPRKEYMGHDVWFGGSATDPDGNIHKGGWDTPYMFCACDKCGERGFEFSSCTDRIKCCDSTSWPDHQKIKNAFAAARSARFEHDAREEYRT